MEPVRKALSEIMDSLAETVRRKNAAVFRIVLSSGEELLAREFIPASPCQNCYSVTKAFTASAVGIAQEMGYLQIDSPVLPYFDRKAVKPIDPKMERVTFRHLLAHLTGIDARYLKDADKFNIGTDDWLSYCLSLPLVYEPGEHYMYSNSNYYLLACLIHRITGIGLGAFAARYLFSPLEIRDYAWAVCPNGEQQGGSGLYIGTEDMGKLGRLYRQKGLWKGTRVLSEAWVSEATRNQVAHTGNTFGLGVAVLQENCFGFSGANSQAVIVRTDTDLVLAAHAYEPSFDFRAALAAALSGEK